MGEDLATIGQFIILVISGAIIPLLLVLYKSRCKRICFGCIERDVLNDDDDDKVITPPPLPQVPVPQPQPEPEP